MNCFLQFNAVSRAMRRTGGGELKEQVIDCLSHNDLLALTYQGYATAAGIYFNTLPILLLNI